MQPPPEQVKPAKPPLKAPAPSFLLTVAGLVVAAALVLGCFGSYIGWMAQRWWKDEYYGHGMFIPMIGAYLIYRRVPALKLLPRERFGWGLPFIVVGLLLHVAASLRDVNFPSGFGLVLTVFGLTAWLWGWQVARVIAFPVGFMAFMVPLGRLLVDRVGQPMQLFAAELGGEMATVLGLRAVIEGTTIHVPGYTFSVAAACSGLKSVIAMTALAALYAYLVDASWWKRLVIFAGSIPVALVANGVRVMVALVLGQALGPGAAEGYTHSFSGMLVFILAFLGLAALGGILRCNRLRPDW